MNKSLLLLLLVCLPTLAFAQITKSGESFTGVFRVNNKVVFIKEIDIKESTPDKAYLILKEWTKLNFAKDVFNSSTNYEDDKKKVTARSRIELLLPEKQDGLREKMIMKYRLDAFIEDNKCIVEITKISFTNNKKENNNTLPKKISAEDLISDWAISLNDINSETRLNTKKSTLYYLNELISSLQTVIEN